MGSQGTLGWFTVSNCVLGSVLAVASDYFVLNIYHGHENRLRQFDDDINLDYLMFHNNLLLVSLRAVVQDLRVRIKRLVELPAGTMLS